MFCLINKKSIFQLTNIINNRIQINKRNLNYLFTLSKTNKVNIINNNEINKSFSNFNKNINNNSLKDKLTKISTVALGSLVLLGGKAKYLLISLKLTKLSSLISILISTGAYAMFFGLPYAIGNNINYKIILMLYK